MRRLRAGAAAVAALLAAVCLPSTATAGAANGPGPWEPWVQEEWTIEAGVYCDFSIGLEVVSQDLHRRTLRAWPDGSVAVEQYSGPLTSYLVDLDTGARSLQDASGDLFVGYDRDGRTATMTTVGPVGVGFRAGDDHPRGYYILDGLHTITVDPDGGKHPVVDAGPATDLCAELG